MRRVIWLTLTVLMIAFSGGCGGGRQFTLAPIKTVDPDNADIPEPKVKEENQIWDIMDMTFFYQIEKLLDLNWTARKVGKIVHVAKGRQADDVNALDEVPNSSWYTNRHYHHRMTLEELARGPDVTAGPDQNGTWTIWKDKSEGGTPGFFIRDARGDTYILKFDSPQFQEMGSSAEVISTKILYACGYNVPQNTIAYFDPAILRVEKGVTVLDRGVRRQMTSEDVERLMARLPRRADGKVRCLASRFVDGKAVGIWNYRGRRKDDPNDLVAHEHRRELRGLRIISSWLSDEDRRAANTLAVYTRDPKTGHHYIKHYLIDMGSTLGSNNIIPHSPKYGNEYLVDPRTIGLQFITLGLYVKPWEFETAHLNPEFPSVGYYESRIFNPGAWFPTYPNPAFEYATLRDAFWGAKIVMAFRDEEIRAIVKTAQMSDPRAEAYLIKTLIERRDKIGRYWFARMNPLDKFRFVRDEDGRWTLMFHDLAVDGHLEEADSTRYHYALASKKAGLVKQAVAGHPAIQVQGFCDKILASNRLTREKEKVFSAAIRTDRHGKKLSKRVTVYFYYPGNNRRPRVVGIVREE